MNKKKKTLWTLTGCFLLLVIVFAGIQSWGKKKEAKAAEETEAEKTYLFQSDELKRIIYSDSTDNSDNSENSDNPDNSEASDNLNSSDTWVFLKEDGTWVYEKDPTITLKDDTMTAMENAFRKIEAVQAIEEPDSLSDYGLEHPKYTLTLQTVDEEHTFLVGNTSGENYYFMEKGGTSVYTVADSVVSQMVWTLDELAETDTFPYVSQDTFLKMTMELPDGTQKVYDSADTEQEDTVSTVSSTLATMYVTNCADYHVTEDTLGSYGLDAGNRTKITISYQSDSDTEEQTMECYIGSKDEEGKYYYVQLSGSQQVVRVLAESVDKLLAGE